MRFVMLTHGSWDDHEQTGSNLKKNCDITDQPAAALLKDLKQSGLLTEHAGDLGRRVRAHTMGQNEPAR